MSLGLDTSVVLRLLTGEPADLAKDAHRAVADARRVTISDLVIGEAYFALRHHYAVPHTEALRSLQALISDSRIVTSGGAGSALAVAIKSSASRSSPGFMDHLILCEYAITGTEVLTFDRNFQKLPGVRLVPHGSS